MVQAPDTRYAKSGDTYIAYQIVGDGTVDLLYIPGFTYSHVDLIWEWPASAAYLTGLASFSRLIVFDKRGIGASDRNEQVPTIENHLDDVTAVLDAAGSEQTAIMGFSEGGTLGVLYTAMYPERVRALIAYASFARFLQADDYEVGIPESVAARLRLELEENWGTGAELAVFAPSYLGDERVERMQARLTRAAASPSAALAYFDMMTQINVRDVLHTVQAPTLVIHRRDDKAVRVGAGRYLAENISGAKFLELEGVDHIPWFGDYMDLIEAVQEFLTGTKPVPEADRVLATVMFSDLVGSTQKAAQLGDTRWASLMESVTAAVAAVVERHRGRLVKTMGDGHLAIFDGPARAIRAAQAIREAIEPLGLVNRTGLHTGEVAISDDDVSGIGVAIASRIERLADPGQILVSRTLGDLVVGSGFRFGSRGPQELKGVPGTWEVLAVEGP